MSKGRLILVSAVVLTSLSGAAAMAASGTAGAQSGEMQPGMTDAQLSQAATLSFDQARVVAMKHLSGKLIALGLNDENGQPVYEASVLGANGQTSIIKIDGATGDVLGQGLAANFGDEMNGAEGPESGGEATETDGVGHPSEDG